MSESRALKVGQVWQEVGPRHPRYVRIVEIDDQSARIQAVVRLGGGSPAHPHGWRPITTSSWRATLAKFNGKRSGYALYEDIP